MSALLVGVADVDVTPPVGVWQAGYGARVRPSEAVRDQLRATALVLEAEGTRAAVIGVDIIGISRASTAAVRRQVAAEAGIPPERLLIACSHTHGGPVTTPIASQPTDPDYLRVLEKDLAGAVAMAARRLTPARLGYGEGRVGFAVHRRLATPSGIQMLPNPEGPVDRRLRLLRLDAAEDGEDPLALLFSVVCHATCLSASNYAISADYPGAARRAIERFYPGESRALFLPGAFGEIRPNLVDERGRFRGATGQELEHIGRAVGAEAVRVAEELSGIPRAPGTTAVRWAGEGGLAGAIRDVPLRYRRLPDRSELERAAERDSGAWERALLARLDRDGTLPEGEDCEVQVLRLGPLRLVAVAGELFQAIGQAIEARLTAAETDSQVLVLGYSNGMAGYLCTAQAYAEGGYESAQAYRGFHRPAPFADDTETRLSDAAAALAAEVRPA